MWSARAFAAAAVIIVVAALAAGCGQQAGAHAGGSASVTAPPKDCGRATPTVPPKNTLDIGNSDNGSSLCVRRGTGVLVMLKGTPTHKWAPIRVSSAALVPKPNGRLMLERGVTGAYFVATRPGDAVITSVRAVCGTSVAPGGTASSPPSSIHCDAEIAFRVSVVVSG
jgi:hypothetical protein